MTNKNREGFAFELALIVIVLIGVAIITLIIMFYNSTNKEIPLEIPQELLSQNNETKKPKNSYLNTLEHYRDKEGDVLPKEVIEVEDKANIVERKNEEGKNSLYKTIESIVEESGAK